MKFLLDIVLYRKSYWGIEYGGIAQLGAHATSETTPSKSAKSNLCFISETAGFVNTFLKIASNIKSLVRKSSAKSSYGGIAQLGERLNGIQEVSGSIPLISTKTDHEAMALWSCST